jgi:replicative DNA helicase
MNAPFSPMGAGADELLRLPPHNFEAEQALLGAILMSNRALENLTEFLRSEHFADPLHGRIYDACTTLTARNQIASPVTLKHYFGEDPDLKEQGGDEYLVRLVGAVVSVRNAEDYGRLVYELAQRRAMIGMGEDLVNDAFDTSSGTATAEVLERHEAALTRLNSQSGETKVSSFSEAVDGAVCEAEAVFKADGRLRGLTTGLTDLDRKMGGLHPTDLIILAGRPSMGKSALAHNIAENAARSLSKNPCCSSAWK